MEKMIFECETITPMFLGGADGKTPELRPPSIKAAMRFWWRALNADKTIEQLRAEEAKIFGGSGESEGRSKFNVRILENNLSINGIGYSPTPHNEDKVRKQKCYNVNQNNLNQTFRIEISKFTKNVELNFLKDLFLLSTILGGWGKRSRRGFGAVKILSIQDKDNKVIEFETGLNNDSIFNILNHLKPDRFEIDTTDKLIKIKYTTNSNSNYPYIKQIIIGHAYSNYDQLLKRIGRASHDNDCYETGFAEKIKGTDKRLASPIYVSIIKNGNSFFPIITILNKYFEEDFTKWNLNFPRNIPVNCYNDFKSSLSNDDQSNLDVYYSKEKNQYKLNQVDQKDEGKKKHYYEFLNRIFKSSVFDKRVNRSNDFIKEIINGGKE